MQLSTIDILRPVRNGRNSVGPAWSRRSANGCRGCPTPSATSLISTEMRFTAGDLMMTSVLRSLDGKNLLERHPNLVAYKARCQARPAFAAALAAQLADFDERGPAAA